MKSFEDILKMTQPGLKQYMKKFLGSKKYHTIDRDGFLYAKGTVPVLLVAHLDRHPNQAERVKTIDKAFKIVGKDVEVSEVWSSPEGICGDDRCGVWTIMNIVSELNCSVLLCEDEEKGSVGANKFCKTEYIKHLDVNYMIQIDRRGSYDLVFYTNDNREFVKWLEDNSDFKEASGSFTDICKLMPESGIAGVNVSSGYHGEHGRDEYIVMDELNHTIETVKQLINTPVDKPFEYVKKKYEYSSCGNYSYGYYSGYDNYGRYYGSTTPSKSKPTATPKNKSNWSNANYNMTDFHVNDIAVLSLSVSLISQETGDEDVVTVYGSTKAECWMRLFMSHPWLSFDCILDIDWE